MFLRDLLILAVRLRYTAAYNNLFLFQEMGFCIIQLTVTHWCPAIFFLSLLMKVHTEAHYGIRLGNPKFPVSTFIHYQNMDI